MQIEADFSQVTELAAEIAGAAEGIEAKAELVVKKTAQDMTEKAQLVVPVRTGNLRSSIGYDIDGTEAEVGPTANYGGYVELGTSRMAPRPYMLPAAEEVSGGFEAAMLQLGGEIL